MGYLEKNKNDLRSRMDHGNGCAVSHTLFNLGLERVIRETCYGRKMNAIGNNILLFYADDVVIVKESEAKTMTSTQIKNFEPLESSRIMGL